MLLIVSNALLFSSALRMTSTNLHKNPESTLAKAFVVNLDGRTDRCKCASYQLRNSPYEITRFAASDTTSWKTQCPDMFVGGPLKHPQVPAVVCSNYRIWEQMNNSPTKYTLIFEDDLNVHPQFWEKVMTFLEKDEQDWDMMFVDVKARNGLWQKDKIEEFHPLKSDGSEGLSGCHFQIIKKETIPKILELSKNKFAPMDRFAKLWAGQGLKVMIWSPGIVNQYSNTKDGSKVPQFNEFCSGSTQTSDIKKKFGSIPALEKEEAVNLAFDCKL